MTALRMIPLLALLLLCSVASLRPAAAQSTGLVYHPRATPCRVVDSRVPSVIDGPLQVNEVWQFSVEEGFSAIQGGTTAPGCHVPLDARVVKLNVKGQPLDTSGGYFRLFNANASPFGTYSSLQLQDQGVFVSGEVDVAIDGNLLVAIHTIVRAHAVADISGYYIPAN